MAANDNGASFRSSDHADAAGQTPGTALQFSAFLISAKVVETVLTLVEIGLAPDVQVFGVGELCE